MDKLLIAIAVPLAATLTIFFLGFTPYPYGWVILTALMMMRLNYLKKK
ncbi:MAG: hypothetical protein V3V31_10375 [Methylococcales bacterium]